MTSDQHPGTRPSGDEVIPPEASDQDGNDSFKFQRRLSARSRRINNQPSTEHSRVLSSLNRMLSLEVAATAHHDSLSAEERRAYLRAHPASRFSATGNAWKDKTPNERKKYLEEHPFSPHNPVHVREGIRAHQLRDAQRRRADLHSAEFNRTRDANHRGAAERFGRAADLYHEAGVRLHAGDLDAGRALVTQAEDARARAAKFSHRRDVTPAGLRSGPQEQQRSDAKVSVEDAWRHYLTTMDGVKTAQHFGVDGVRTALRRHPEYQRVAGEMKRIRATGDPSHATHPDVVRYVAAHPEEVRRAYDAARTPEARRKRDEALRRAGHVIPDEETIKQIVPMLQKGMTVPQAARALGVNPVSIRHYGKKHLGEDAFRKLDLENRLSSRGVSHGVSTTNKTRPGMSGNRGMRGPTKVKVQRNFKN